MLFFYFAFTYCVLFITFYTNPQKLFIFFLKKLDSPFFIIDNNIFIKEYMYSCFFLTSRVCMPFLICFIIVMLRSLSDKNSYFFYMFFLIIYMHIIAIFFNYLQFELFFNNSSFFNQYSEGFDLSNRLFNIKGFFWDTLYAFLLFGRFFFFCFYFPTKLKFCADYNFAAKPVYDKVNRVVWSSRILIYLFYFYFFIGLSVISLWIFFVFFVEILFFIFRFFFFIKLLIKLAYLDLLIIIYLIIYFVSKVVKKV